MQFVLVHEVTHPLQLVLHVLLLLNSFLILLRGLIGIGVGRKHATESCNHGACGVCFEIIGVIRLQLLLDTVNLLLFIGHV